jgi:hypothetical protein
MCRAVCLLDVHCGDFQAESTKLRAHRFPARENAVEDTHRSPHAVEDTHRSRPSLPKTPTDHGRRPPGPKDGCLRRRSVGPSVSTPRRRWVSWSVISPGKGAELAGLTRAEFIDELGRANVSAIQTSVDELRDEMKLVRDAGR